MGQPVLGTKFPAAKLPAPEGLPQHLFGSGHLRAHPASSEFNEWSGSTDTGSRFLGGVHRQPFRSLHLMPGEFPFSRKQSISSSPGIGGRGREGAQKMVMVMWIFLQVLFLTYFYSSSCFYEQKRQPKEPKLLVGYSHPNLIRHSPLSICRQTIQKHSV
jgi:hypothetical protein